MDEIAPVAPAAPAAAPFAAKREALRESTRMLCAWCGKPLPLETGTLRIFIFISAEWFLTWFIIWEQPSCVQ